MRKTLAIIFFSLFAFFAADSPAEDTELNPEKAFYRANIDYEAGNYDKALDEYSKVLAKGLASGNIYYNMGNCYMKKGRVGKAIFCYEKSAQYVPRDSDLLSNRRYAKALMKRPDPPSGEIKALKWLLSSLDFLSMKEAIYLALLFFCAFSVYLIVTKVFRVFTAFSNIAITVMSLVFVLLLVPVAKKIHYYEKGAIVTASLTTDARYEPLKDATVHFTLYEGMTVSILRKKGDWAKVRRSDGKIGWVPGDTIDIMK